MTQVNPQQQPQVDPSNPAHQTATAMGIMAGDQYQSIVTLPPLFGGTPLMDMADLDQRTAAASQQQPAKEHPVPMPNGPQGAAGGASGQDWRVDVLNRIGAPSTPENLRLMSAWQKAEGGGSDGPSHSDFNWLNTTYVGADAPFVGEVNSVGVKKYANYQAGINATVGALTNGHYQFVLAYLNQGNDAMAVAQAIANSPWGTGAGVERVLKQGG